MQQEHVLVRRQQLVRNVHRVSVDILVCQSKVLRGVQSASALEGLLTVDSRGDSQLAVENNLIIIP